MDVSDDILQALQEAVTERFGESVVDVHIEAVELDEDKGTIRFDLRVETLEDPSAFAKKLYGLTGMIRRNLRNENRRLFPVITPVVGPSASKVASA